MKRLLAILILLSVAALFVSCGGKTEVKQEVKQNQKQAYDKMNDTSFNNVMAVLKEALDAEKSNNDSGTKLNTAKAYILLIKFIHTDKQKVTEAGMSDDDINFLVTDAKDKAKSRLNDIIGNQTAPKSLKDEAQSKLNELEAL